MEYAIKNVGWSIGSYCNAVCAQCYSREARKSGDLLSEEDVLTVLNKLHSLGISTMNLGGNEPIFTHSLDPKDSILPFIIREVKKRNITLGITTNGTTMLTLNDLYPKEFAMVDDWDVSIDSPFPDEHDRNRGSGFFDKALRSLELAKSKGLSCSVVYCLMNFNSTPEHAYAISELTRKYSVNLRINTLKPTRKELLEIEASPNRIHSFFRALSAYYKVIHNGDIAAAISKEDPLSNCPCGKFSFAISPKKNNVIRITPCVYLQSYAVGNILNNDIASLLKTDIFRLFREYDHSGCEQCNNAKNCAGGCLAYILLTSEHGKCDRRCPALSTVVSELAPSQLKQTIKHLVHENYLCTWIGENK